MLERESFGFSEGLDEGMMFSPFDFESVADYVSGKNCLLRGNSFCEPNSVLDSRIPSGLTSPSTLSSSLGGGSSGSGGAFSTDTTEAAAVVSGQNPYPKWQQDSTTATSSELLQILPSLSGGGARAQKCAMEDWESVLSESAAASPFHEQSIFRWNMGDVEDPAINESPSKLIQFGGSTVAELGFSGGFGVVDQANFSNNSRSSYEKIDSEANHFSSNPIKFHQNSQNLIYPSLFDSSAELKPLVLNPQLLIHHQTQPFFSPFFSPLPYAEQQEQTAPPPPPAKRLNSGGSFIEARHQLNQQDLQLVHYPHHRPKMNGGDHHQQQIIDHLYKAADLLQTGNPSLAQEILARLNHHLSPIGSPFQRAAFYFKEALQLLLHSPTPTPTTAASLVLEIDAYKSFSEISPLIHFANFTTNQALLESLSGFNQIHIIDFDIGYGGQWASLMQELALTSGGATVLKITALVCPSAHNHLELTLTRENLTQFANDINIGFEFNILSIESIRSNSWSLPLHPNDNEAVAVNIPVGCLTNYQLSAPLALRFVKQLSPKIIVSVNRACDRPDLPFPNHIIHTLEYYSSVLESLDAVNVNADTLQKMERFLIQPGMEKLVMRREKSYQWRSLFVSCGFCPVSFSNPTVSQAEYIVKRIPVGGFEVEKRQSSLVLCWQMKELLSASIWRC